MYGFVYITTNNINNKKYIGKCAYNRLNGWENYLGSGKLLKQAIKKYGIDKFSRHIVLECETLKELDIAEKYYIQSIDACNNDEYYNLAEGGTGGNTRLGYTEDEYKVYCAKFSAPGELNGMYGRKHTAESNAKNKESVMKHWDDPEFVEKHRQATVNAMKKVPKETFAYSIRSRNKTLICPICGNVEQVVTSQQLYCSECKSKYNRYELSTLNPNKNI